ncbi:MAG: Polar-differentiation response regulator DivK, partial [Planctomycetota bacterium]
MVGGFIGSKAMRDGFNFNEKDVLTTGEVARICNVASRTVSKWFDSGQLAGYRIPGSKDRRIPVSNLMAFMKKHNIPMDGLRSGAPRVL